MKANHSRQGRNARRCLITMLVVVASLPFAAREVAQDRSNPMAATVAQSFTIIERSFVSLADAMPEEKYGFKPTNGEFKDARTFGEQVKHVACGNFAFFNEIEKKEPPSGCATGGPSPAKTKAELLTYLRESFDYAQSMLRTMTQANALEPVSGPYGGTSTRLGLTTLAVWHASDHYGQLVVYLRMNGIVPPSSQPAQSSERKEITVLPKILEAYVGTYQLGPKVNIMITLEEGQLMGQVSGQVKVALFASSNVKFFCKLVDAEIEFTKDEKGTVIGLILHQGGQDMNAPRTSDQVLVRKEVTGSSKILGQ